MGRTLTTVDRGITRMATPGRPAKYRVNLRTRAGRLTKVFDSLAAAVTARDQWLAGDLSAPGSELRAGNDGV